MLFFLIKKFRGDDGMNLGVKFVKIFKVFDSHN